MKPDNTKIDKTISIEELLSLIPTSVNYLSEKRIRCFVCGDPIWGTLESASLEKGFTPNDVDTFVKEINELQ